MGPAADESSEYQREDGKTMARTVYMISTIAGIWARMD
jgi:hypothetical protein